MHRRFSFHPRIASRSMHLRIPFQTEFPGDSLVQAIDRAEQTVGSCDFLVFKVLVGAAVMKAHRRAALSAVLRSRGLHLRSDSWLCTSYIEGRPQAGTLQNVVEGVEEMHWYFTCTQYAVCRGVIADEHWEDAMEMAADSGSHPMEFHIALDSAALSVASKDRAIRWLLAERRERGVEAELEAPERVRHRLDRLVATLTTTGDVVNSRNEPPRYAELDTQAKRTMRQQVRQQVCAYRLQETAALEDHLSTLLLAAAGPIGEEHHFPASLSRHQRALLHDRAEELHLAHESRGTGHERYLVVWRVATVDATESESSEGDVSMDEESIELEELPN